MNRTSSWAYGIYYIWAQYSTEFFEFREISVKFIKPDTFRRVCITSLGRQTEQVKILWQEKRKRMKYISKNHRATWRGWVGDGYPLFLQRKVRAGHVVKFWSNIFDTNCRIRQCWMLELGNYWAVKGGSSFGDVLDLLALQVAVVGGCDSCAGEGSLLSPWGAGQLWQSAGDGHAGASLSFSFGEWENEPPNYRLIPKMLSAPLGLFCGREFVTGLGGKSLTLG